MTAAMVGGVLVSGGASPADATYSCSTETTKFVYDTNTPASYGARSALYSYNHLPICSGKWVVNTEFVRLDSSYDWIETGLAQYSGDDSAHAHDWVEYGTWPGPVFTSVVLDTQAGVLTTGTTYSLMLRNGTGTTWNVYISHTSNPDTATWNHTYTTPNLVGDYGYPESEAARNGDNDASLYATKLERELVYLGSWSSWSHLGCDYNQRSNMTWWAEKFSEQSWQMVPGAPTGGQC